MKGCDIVRKEAMGFLPKIFLASKERRKGRASPCPAPLVTVALKPHFSTWSTVGSYGVTERTQGPWSARPGLEI